MRRLHWEEWLKPARWEKLREESCRLECEDCQGFVSEVQRCRDCETAWLCHECAQGHKCQ